MNKGVAMLMNLGVTATRLAGGRIASEQQRVEMRGLAGVMNIEFIGPDAAGWHVQFGEEGVVMRKGLAENARATVRMKPEDYLAMIAGDLSYSTARMTGKVRVAGDGHFGIMFGAFVENFRAAPSLPGMRGRIGRWIVRRALAKGNYQPRTR